MRELRASGPDEASTAAVHVAAYLEVMSLFTDEAAALLRQYRDASRTDVGCVRLEVLQRSGRPDHFAIIATWKEQSAFEAHGMTAHTRHVRESLQPLQVSPIDERLHHGLAVASMPTAHEAGSTYVLTHVDAIPPAKDEALTLLQQLAEASRTAEGNRCFEVLQQRSRQNHFTVVEIWRDQQSREAHAMAMPTRHFREQFQPLSGSLYDERLYQSLD